MVATKIEDALLDAHLELVRRKPWAEMREGFIGLAGINTRHENGSLLTAMATRILELESRVAELETEVGRMTNEGGG